MTCTQKRISALTTATITVLILILCLPLFCPVAAAADVDNRLYADLLRTHVKNGRVSYDGLKNDQAVLDRYLAVLSAVNPDTLTHNQAFAFYINAYNAFTLKLVLTRYPEINSIKEIGSFFSGPWSKEFIPLNGHTVSLDYIEHQVLRPKFKDPRVHFAINCAAKGCPPLLDVPYEGESLETQLNAQARAFINNLKFNHVQGATLYLSKIFSWFKEDFNDNPLFFIRQYADAPLSQALDKAGLTLSVSYLDYDWSLNRR